MNEETELTDLYALAIEELASSGESLTVWAGGDAINQQDTLAAAFAAKFPKVPIDIKVDLSKFHDLTIYKELLDGDLTPDVTMLQTSNDFEDWKKLGVLEPFKSVGFDNIRDEFKDPDGAFSAFRMFAFLPQYAKSGLKGQVPSDLTDFLTDDYIGKLVLPYPHDDDAVLFVYDRLLQTHGEDFLGKLAALKPHFLRGTAVPPLLVGQYGFLGSLTGYETVASQPSQSFIPKSDFFISWAQRMAMFKLTKHKAAARLFIAYVQSQEFQASLGHYSVRKDASSVRPWIGCYKNTDPVGFYDFMRDRSRIGQLRALMKSYFGPIEGDSPLVDYQMIKETYRPL